MLPVKDLGNQLGKQAIFSEFCLCTRPNGRDARPVQGPDVPAGGPELLQKQLHAPAAGKDQPG